MAALQLNQLQVRLGGREVIGGLDLEVKAGEFIVLLGPSGCGKSTLLHAIAGLLEVQAGQVMIDGRDLTDAEPSERGVGMVFQSYALYPSMTVERNLSFGLRVAGLPRAEIERRVAHAATLLQLQDLLTRKPAQLSGGQRQRVAIGRALVREAQLFLLDEPLSNLDAQLRGELRRELKLLHQRLGNTMVYVTHDQVEAMTLATQIVVMQGGRIQQVGTPAEVYEHPANLFVAGFVGAPAINRLTGTLQVADGRVQFVNAQFRVPLGPGWLARAADGPRNVVLAIRAEHVRLGAAAQAAGPTGVAEVELVEPLGNQHVLWLRHQGVALAALQPGAPTALPGEPVSFAFDPAWLLLFDASSGRLIGTGDTP